MTTPLLPWQIDQSGRTALADPNQRLRNMIEQVLFTAPGERVNRPTFGSGLRQFVFAPSSDEMAMAVEFTIQSALLEWMGDRIQVEQVDVTADDATVRITIAFVVLADQQRQSETFVRSLLD